MRYLNLRDPRIMSAAALLCANGAAAAAAMPTLLMLRTDVLGGSLGELVAFGSLGVFMSEAFLVAFWATWGPFSRSVRFPAAAAIIAVALSWSYLWTQSFDSYFLHAFAGSCLLTCLLFVPLRVFLGGRVVWSGENLSRRPPHRFAIREVSAWTVGTAALLALLGVSLLTKGDLFRILLYTVVSSIIAGLVAAGILARRKLRGWLITAALICLLVRGGGWLAFERDCSFWAIVCFHLGVVFAALTASLALRLLDCRLAWPSGKGSPGVLGYIREAWRNSRNPVRLSYLVGVPVIAIAHTLVFGLLISIVHPDWEMPFWMGVAFMAVVVMGFPFYYVVGGFGFEPPLIVVHLLNGCFWGFVLVGAGHIYFRLRSRSNRRAR